MKKVISSGLTDWSDFESDDWPTMLLGNGLSMNLWPGFGYARLLDQAQLGQASTALFTQLKTSNFESVLEAVMHAEMVLDALGRRAADVKAVYTDIRDSLFEAVRKVHVPHASVPTSTLHTLGKVLNERNKVFTTNYDLLPYWALMEAPNVSIADYFWTNGGRFDPGNASLFDGWTGLYFLHGGIHLWQSDTTGTTGKWTNAGAGLLRLTSQFNSRTGRLPLFVSEATSRRKLRTIRRSDYLTFCLDGLRADEEDTIVFGHGLAAQDDHVVEALRSGQRKRIAVGLRPAGRDQILAAKGRVLERLSGHSVVFFDSTTHPLGNPALTLSFP